MQCTLLSAKSAFLSGSCTSFVHPENASNAEVVQGAIMQYPMCADVSQVGMLQCAMLQCAMLQFVMLQFVMLQCATL